VAAQLLTSRRHPQNVGVDLLNESQHQFCAALKAARERSGLKLTDIAATTKVCPSYFSALERNDLGVWPKGIFRRSFFRGYASAIGLPVEETLTQFLALFPEEERPASPPPEPARESSVLARAIEALKALFAPTPTEADLAPAKAADQTAWLSDARRVRPPGEEPRIRIRIKLS
jgi:transcriptional regulator with XRE-family HTH domain